MFDQLKKIINPDNESLVMFEQIKKEHHKDKLEFEAKLLSTARKQALILGLLIVVTLIALLYAYVSNIKADEDKIVLENKIEQLEANLKICLTK